MRAFLACGAILLLAACEPPSASVEQEPPGRLATQLSDLPPEEFLDADLVITRGGDQIPYCFGVDELLIWLDKVDVTDQRWTLLEDGKWRLDGYDHKRKEHTVWVFEHGELGVELVAYKDSDIAIRDHESIMQMYYLPLMSMHSDYIREKYNPCKSPYES